MSQFFLGLIWLIEGDYKFKLTRLRESRAFWILISLYLIHVVGLLYTADFDYALDDLRIKLPLLLIPFFFTATRPFSWNEIRILLSFFILGLILSTGYSYVHFQGVNEWTGMDVREASYFISHIRLSLMLSLGIAIMIYAGIRDSYPIPVQMFLALCSFWFLYFMIKFQMLTGLFAFVLISLLTIEWYLFSRRKLWTKLSGILLAVFLIGGLGGFVYNESKSFIEPVIVQESEKIKWTPDSNLYDYNEGNFQIENGNRVSYFLCEFELEENWNQVSSIPYLKPGNTGETIRGTLIRYLTSKGVPKDGNQVRKLEPFEIAAIENGITNYRFIHGPGLRKRIYETAWELHNYLVNNDNPEGNTVAQRLEFWASAIYVIKKNPLIGVGTGDIVSEMQKAYTDLGSKLRKEYRLKPHNQYLSMTICFGFFGLSLILFVIVWSVRQLRGNYLGVVIVTVLAFSMLGEDTLETQIGVSLFAAFISLALLQGKEFVKPRTDLNS